MSGKCECGAFKTYNAKEGTIGHSSWCPWASGLKKMCDGFDCWGKATHWILYIKDGRKFNYCDGCQVDAMSSPNVTVYDFGLLW